MKIQSLEERLIEITDRLNSISGTVSNPVVRQQLSALSTEVVNGSKQLATIRKDLATNIKVQNNSLKKSSFPFFRQPVTSK